MSDVKSVLLTQKPDSAEPTEGASRRFTIEERPKKSGEGTWLKAKNERDGFGEPYKILKADRLDDYIHPQHGTFHQFSLLLEPSSQEGAGAANAGNGAASVGGAASAASDSDRTDQINRSVAFKAATEIVTAQLARAGEDWTDDQVRQSIATMTNALLPIVTGERDEVVTSASEPTSGQPSEEIPFTRSAV